MRNVPPVSSFTATGGPQNHMNVVTPGMPMFTGCVHFYDSGIETHYLVLVE